MQFKRITKKLGLLRILVIFRNSCKNTNIAEINGWMAYQNSFISYQCFELDDEHFEAYKKITHIIIKLIPHFKQILANSYFCKY